MDISDDKLVELFENVSTIKEQTASTKEAIERLHASIVRLDADIDNVKTFKTSVVVKLAGWFVVAVTAVMGVIMAGLAAIGRWVLPGIVKALADAGVALPFVA